MRRLLLLLFGALLMLPGASAHANPAEPDVSIFAPSFRVPPGALLSLDVYGGNSAERLSNLDIRIPYDGRYLTPVTASFTDPRDWVSGVGSGSISLSFRGLRKLENRKATFVFRIDPATSSDTVLTLRSSYTWRTESGVKGSANSPISSLLVLPADARPDYVVTPLSAAAGQPRRFAANRLIPNEEISVWVNLPDGTTVALMPTVYASERADVELGYDADGLAPGWYQMVLASRVSRQTVQIPFEVR